MTNAPTTQTLPEKVQGSAIVSRSENDGSFQAEKVHELSPEFSAHSFLRLAVDDAPQAPSARRLFNTLHVETVSAEWRDVGPVKHAVQARPRALVWPTSSS